MSSVPGPRARSNSHSFFMYYFWSVCSWYCYHHNLLFIECHPFIWDCVEHTPDRVFPQGNGNEIQMVMIHEITIKLLRVCKRGLQWDQPWKAQLKEVFDRRGRGESCLTLKEQDMFQVREASWRSATKGIKSGGWKWEHQDDSGHPKGASWGGAEWGQVAPSRVVHLWLYPGAMCYLSWDGLKGHVLPYWGQGLHVAA